MESTQVGMVLQFAYRCFFSFTSSHLAQLLSSFNICREIQRWKRELACKWCTQWLKARMLYDEPGRNLSLTAWSIRYTYTLGTAWPASVIYTWKGGRKGVLDADQVIWSCSAHWFLFVRGSEIGHGVVAVLLHHGFICFSLLFSS